MVKKVNYILLEDERITALGLKRIVSRLRPDWSLLAESDSSTDIPRFIKMMPDVIMSDVFLSDGTSTDVFFEHACPIPVILLSGYPEADHHRHRVPNLIECLYKPISHSDMARTIERLERTLETASA